MIARLRQLAGRFGLAALLFTARRGLGEFPRNIDKFPDAAAELGQILLNPGTTVADNFSGPPLIPIDAAGLNDLVQYPALLAPAFHFPFGFDAHRKLQSVPVAPNASFK